jgi:hypothetical protein
LTGGSFAAPEDGVVLAALEDCVVAVLLAVV